MWWFVTASLTLLALSLIFAIVLVGYFVPPPFSAAPLSPSPSPPQAPLPGYYPIGQVPMHVPGAQFLNKYYFQPVPINPFVVRQRSAPPRTPPTWAFNDPHTRYFRAPNTPFRRLMSPPPSPDFVRRGLRTRARRRVFVPPDPTISPPPFPTPSLGYNVQVWVGRHELSMRNYESVRNR